MSITFLTYWWQEPGYPNSYTADDVRLLQRMVSRNVTSPHDFAVITDKPGEFSGDADIRAIPIILDKHVPKTCSVRLMTFHPNGANLIGERVFQMDLDTVVVGSLDDIIARQEDTVLWRNPGRVPWDYPRSHASRPLYNGSFVLHRCGTRPDVWRDYKINTHWVYDDQTWLSMAFGPGAPYFDGERDGIYRLARADTPGSGVNGELPSNARIITFPGSEGKPTRPEVMAANPWIAEFRR